MMAVVDQFIEETHINPVFDNVRMTDASAVCIRWDSIPRPSDSLSEQPVIDVPGFPMNLPLHSLKPASSVTRQ
jgi:hypothetical protein